MRASGEMSFGRHPAGAEKLKFENCLQVTVLGRRGRLHSETTLPHAPVGLSIWTKFARKGGQWVTLNVSNQFGWLDPN